MPNRTTASLSTIINRLPLRWRRAELAVTFHGLHARDTTAEAEAIRAVGWLGTWGVERMLPHSCSWWSIVQPETLEAA